ncbi:MAG TPA: phospholipase D-like domain-containing protein [Chitinophagales bacterium]|nr:phospholipase D-like domain-containing protein [Chitinophagales bacterium]HMW93500.1 phospholipase D-like domain-containing protein [Chitinophagales bacterium]HMZ93002.1 phospholipase D-like domain-containing protein [Chitinophagales bacterium]HNG25934.1 phospholipase D-like domain-containing protein [Chitinophagales bacterium]
MIKLSKNILLIIGLLFNSYTLSAQAETSVYFSPNGGCEEHVVELINKTQKSLDVAIYAINNQQIIAAIEGAYKRGVKIRILVDRVQAFSNKEKILELKSYGLDIRIHSKNKIQHNKFAVSDGMRMTTGSFNWTKPAQESNEENCLFIDDSQVIEQYKSRFSDYLWIINTEEKSEVYFDKMVR